MAAGILDQLRAHETTRLWLEGLEQASTAAPEPTLPAPGELFEILTDLWIPKEDVQQLIDLLPTLEASTELRWLLAQTVRVLSDSMGEVDAPARFPTLPESLGLIHRYFFIYPFVAVLPRVRAYHRAHQIPEDVAMATLRDLGRHMTRHRRNYGIGGLNVPFWLMLHFRGAIYELGRLQFERARLGQRTGEAIRAAGFPHGPGDPTLSVHIPELNGPLSPEACDESFARAEAFFPKHFPDETYDVAVCHSWLLDEQLAEYLPEDANIIRFQRRFRLAHRPDPDSGSILYFIFGYRQPDFDELPQRSTLERAVVSHLKAGREWHCGAGWLLL
jgi:hypothetical protein